MPLFAAEREPYRRFGLCRSGSDRAGSQVDPKSDDALQATIKDLQQQVQEAKAQAAAAQTAAASTSGSDLDLKVKWKGAPDVGSAGDRLILVNGVVVADDLGLRAGNFKTPNGLEQMGSANYITFNEAWG